jgi:hypothetical protein
MCFHISCVGIDNDLFCTLIKQNKISSWSCSFCAVKSSTESLSDSPLTSNKNQCENQTITISTVELKDLIKATLDEQIIPLTAHISELQILIQNSAAENSLLRSEFSKLNSNFQVLKSNEVKTVNEIICNDQQVKIFYAECVSKNSQKTIIVRPKNKSQSTAKTKADLMNNADLVETLAKIGKVKNPKDEGILLGCDNNSNLEQEVKGRLSKNYEIHEVKPYRPRIRISGLSQNINHTRLLEYLLKQNEFIFDSNSEIKLLKLSPLKNKEDIYQAIFEVDLNTYKKATSIGRRLVGLDGSNIQMSQSCEKAP